MKIKEIFKGSLGSYLVQFHVKMSVFKLFTEPGVLNIAVWGEYFQSHSLAYWSMSVAITEKFCYTYACEINLYTLDNR